MRCWIALFAALPWVKAKKGHIKGNLFESLFSHGLNKLMDLIGDIALAAAMFLVGLGFFVRNGLVHWQSRVGVCCV